MRNIVKSVAAVVCAVAMAVGFSTVANADGIQNKSAAAARAVDTTTYMTPGSNVTTSGGSGGKVTIRSRVFKRFYQPAGSVRVYYCGVVSDISTGDGLITTFRITGNLYSNSKTTPISASGTANSVTAQDIRSDGYYDYCASVTTTSSSAFGTSRQECNCAIK